MKKILYILIIIFLLAFVFYLFQDFSMKKDWKTYKNSRYDFSLQYPDNWSIGDPETNGAGRIIKSPNDEVECYGYGFENVLLNENGNPQTLDEFIAWLTDDGETDILDRWSDVLGEEDAVRVYMDRGDTIWDAVYTLNSERGLGFYCVYRNNKEREEYKNVFKKMKESFKINEETTFIGNECLVLLEGVAEPLKDFKTFFDEDYTTVTMIDRNNWDKSKLPDKVLSLEDNGYSCYPMPYEYNDSVSGGGIKAQPEVTKVEWNCELHYNEWYYVSEEDRILIDSYESEGFSCEKVECFGEEGDMSFVWFCYK